MSFKKTNIASYSCDLSEICGRDFEIGTKEHNNAIYIIIPSASFYVIILYTCPTEKLRLSFSRYYSMFVEHEQWR